MAIDLEYEVLRDEAKQAYRHKQRALLRTAYRGPLPILLGLSAFVAIVGTTVAFESVVASADATQASIFYY